MPRLPTPWLAVLFCCLVSACTSPDLPAPEPTSISPDHVVRLQRAEKVPVLVRGENLAAGLEVDLQTGEVRFDGSFEALLGDTQLEDVEPLIEESSLALHAVVPAEMPVGVWDLTVRSPSGGEGTLAEAFEVRTVAVVELTAEMENDPPLASDRVTLTATVRDNRENKVLAGTVDDVLFELVLGTGQLLNPRLVDGSVRIDYDTAAVPEDARIRATEMLSGNGVSSTILIDSPGGPVLLALTSSNPAPVAGDPITLYAELQDEHGNPIPFGDPADFTFRLIQGRGLLSSPTVFGGQGVVIYSTYRRTETARVQVEENLFGGIPPAQLEITTVGGPPVGVTIEPAALDVGAGQSALLLGLLVDAHDNPTAAADAGDIQFSIVGAGNGSLDAPALVDGAVQVTYTAATDPVPDQALVEAVEQVTGTAASAQATLNITAGPVDHFDVVVGFDNLPAGSPFNILLSARDAYGHLVTTFDGSVAISDSTGSITPTASGRFVSGERTVTVTIAVAQAGVRILVDDHQGHTGASTPFNVVGAGIDRFEIDAIADQQAGAPFVLTIRALDEMGNPIESYAGGVDVADATGTISPDQCAPFVDGACSASVTVVRAHPADVVLVNDGLGHSGASNTFAVGPGAPAAIVFTNPPLNILPNAASPALSIQVQDALGNPSPVGAPTQLNLTHDSANGAFDTDVLGPFNGDVTSIDLAAGVAEGQFYYRDSSTGDFTLTVWDPGGGLSAAMQLIKVTDPGQPSRLRIVSVPPSVTAGVAAGAFVVQIQDATGTPVSSHPLFTVDLSASNPSALFAATEAGPFDGAFTSLDIADGASGGAFYLYDTLAGPLTVAVSAGAGGLIGESVEVLVHGGPVDRFEIDPIADQQAGRPFTSRIVALDAWDNVADGYSGIVTLSDFTGTVSPAYSGAFWAGVRTGTITVFGAIDPNELLVDDGDGHTGASNAFRVGPGPVDRFEVAQVPSPQTAGQAFTLSCTAIDAWDNLATGFIGVVNLTDSTGTVEPVQSGTFSAGTLDQPVAITRAGPAVFVTVDDGQSHTGQSAPFEVVAGPLDHFAVGPVSNFVAISTVFDLPISARDEYGNLVSAFSGTVQIQDLTGTIQPALSGQFSEGLRTEAVVIEQLLLDDLITVDDQAGHAGQSNPFDVIDSQPAQLVATLECFPFAVIEGESFEVRLQVANDGDYGVQAVFPAGFLVGGTGSAALLSGPTPAQADIPGRSEVVFTWEYTTGLGGTGWLDLSGRAEGTETDGGLPIQSNPAEVHLPISEASCLLNPLAADAGLDQSFSCGDGLQLGGDPTVSGGVGIYNIAWQPGDDLDDSTAANPQASPVNTTLYQVDVQDELGCTDRDRALASLADGPQASFSIDPALACKDDPITFDASGSSGAESYSWDFGDTGQATGQVVTHAFADKGWYLVNLTVQDAAGCTDSLTLPVSISDGGEIAGIIPFTVMPDSVPADGVSFVRCESAPITKCNGGVIGKDKKIHILTTRGRITTLDADGADGLQVKTPADNSGIIRIAIEADRVGGSGRLLIMTEKGTRETRGWAEFTFFGSTSLPRVVDFGPAGHGDLPPPRFVARFDKPMDEASVVSALVVADDDGPVSGSVSWEPERQTATFTPDGLLDPAFQTYTITVGSNAMDAWGNPLDGNLDGVQDSFSWTFGNLADGDRPTLTCADPVPNPFSPDGDDKEDTSSILFDASDGANLGLVRLVVRTPDGTLVRTIVERLPQAGSITDATIGWDGHDESGLLVDNGLYPFELFVTDQAGNRSSPCTGTFFEVQSVLDPAEFP